MPDRRPTSSSPPNSISPGPVVIFVLVVLLLILHQDNWFWSDGRLVFGFMPMGMFWHVGISIAAAMTWALATKIAWPVSEDTRESTADEGDQ